MLKLNPLLFCVLLLFITAWKVTDTIASSSVSSHKVIPEENNFIPKDSVLSAKAPERKLMKYEPVSATIVELDQKLPESVNSFIFLEDQLIIGCEDGIYKASMSDKNLTFHKTPNSKGPVYDILTTELGSMYIKTPEAGLLFSPDFTGFWLRAYPNLTKTIIYNIWEEKSGLVIVGGSKGIHTSNDMGKTWTHQWDGSHASEIVKVKDHFYAATGKGILVSDDKGATWKNDYSLNGSVSVLKTIDEKAIAIVIAEKDAKFYGPDERTEFKVLMMDKNGKKWEDIGKSIPDYKFANDIIIFNNEILCSTDVGVFKSKDSGKSWERILEAAGENWAYKFMKHNGVLYMIKGFNGC